MFENTNNPKLCPVRAFELYLSKLHPSLNLLWQRPKVLECFNESDSVWYCNSPLGKNTLRSLMKTISVDCKLSHQEYIIKHRCDSVFFLSLYIFLRFSLPFCTFLTL